MAHFVGLDVSVKETSVCVVDDAGKVILEHKVLTEPDTIIALLTSLGATFGRLGIAQMMRVGLFKPVHVKTLVAQEQRMLLTSRKLLQRKMLDVESDLRGTL